MNSRISAEEAKVLRELAKQVKEISEDPKWAEKVQLWKDLNSLKKTRPLVLCQPQGAWREVIPESELVTKDPLFRWFEDRMRQFIYKSKYMHDDDVITDDIFIPYAMNFTDWVDDRHRPFDARRDHSGAFDPCIKEVSDFGKLHYADFEIDEKLSNENFEIGHELFDGILNVHHGEPYYSDTLNPIKGWGASMIDIWMEIRGMQNFLYDVYMEPEMTKDAMEILTEGVIRIIKKGIKLGIWHLNNNGYSINSNTSCGSNGLGFTDELPAADFSGEVRTKDLWNYSMAQECTTVSPDMLEEFVLPYQARVCEMFGMNSFGCCENNDKKWEVIKKWIPNLREVSVTQYCNYQTAVEHMQDKYVMCFKPKPASQVIDFSPEKIKREMTELMEIGKGTHMIVRLCELETVCNEPSRLSAWIDITSEIAQKYN